jgi:hypothetical protein
MHLAFPADLRLRRSSRRASKRAMRSGPAEAAAVSIPAMCRHTVFPAQHGCSARPGSVAADGGRKRGRTALGEQ